MKKKDTDNKGGYIVVRSSEYLRFNTLEEAEKAAKKYLEDRFEGEFWIAKVHEVMSIECRYEITKEMVE